jgi:hypothetical protein
VSPDAEQRFRLILLNIIGETADARACTDDDPYMGLERDRIAAAAHRLLSVLEDDPPHTASN